MKDHGLDTDEHLLIKSRNVRIKGSTFTAVLTNRRLRLTGETESEPQEEIEYDTDSFRSVSLSGTDTVNIEIAGGGLAGNLVLSFPGDPPRPDEPEDWASALHIMISSRIIPEDRLFKPEKPLPVADDIDTLFEAGTGPEETPAINNIRKKPGRRENRR